MGDVLTTERQIGKISPQKPEELTIFPVLVLFFHLSLLKIWYSHYHKNIIFVIDRSK